MVIEINPIKDGELCYELTVPHDFQAGSRIHFGHRGHTKFNRLMDDPIPAGTVIRFAADGDPFIAITSPPEAGHAED